MLKTMLYDPNSGQCLWGGEELLGEWRKTDDSWLWADFEAEDRTREAEIFSDQFGFDPLVISDAQQMRHPPKVESFESYFFLLFCGLNDSSIDIRYATIQIALFVGKRFLVTRRPERAISIDTIWAEAQTGKLNVERGPIHVSYRILRVMTDRYGDVLVGLDLKLEELEREVFENPSRDQLLEKLLNYTGNLKRLHRIFTYHHGLFSHLRHHEPLIHKRRRHEFNDLFEHTEQLESLTRLHKELADDLMNGYLTVNGNRLNQIMKMLTIVTVVFLPLSLLSGIYGMNFENMPGLGLKYAYFVLLGVMGGIAVGLLLLFRKMKWL